ncbi:MAG: hypothetical protein ACLFWI_01275 [Coleofasciculus sp.]|uniref:hypothetical protein n=1 Tax=Coleofasciculus sp. TaxID=3100458 RepID=UPI003A187F72
MARKNQLINRRRFLVTSALTSSGLITANLLSKSGLAQSTAPGIVTSDKMRPQTPYGVASGDVTSNQAVIWSKSDRVSRMIVDYDTSESFRNPFWEFVAGPLNAGTFERKRLDNTFGPQVKFQSVSYDLAPNRPPSEGLQFFGTVKIDGRSEVMTVALHNLEGKTLYSVDLIPEV